MKQNEDKIKNKIIVIVIAYLIYVLSLVLNNTFFINLMFSIIFFILLYYFVISIKNVKEYKLIWIALFSCFCVYSISYIACIIYENFYDINLKILDESQYIYMFV